MNRFERIENALANKTVDRVPVTAWLHFSDVDQDPVSLAKRQVEFNEKYDFDFIKLMPFGTYSIQDYGAQLKIYGDKYKEPIVLEPGITELNGYKELEVLEGTHGTLGKQVQLAAHVQKLTKDKTPFIQTIFSPLSTLKKLTKDKVMEDLKKDPKAVKHALDVITQTTINFVEENIKQGVSGFFFATQNASYDVLDIDTFNEFAMPYDLKVMESYQDKTFFNVMHIHGSNIMFNEVLENYPSNCLNWHDRATEPSLEQARKLTDKAFLGGIQEVPYFVDGVLQYDSIMAKSNEEEIKTHVKEAIEQVDGKGLIVGPGCVIDPRTPEANYHALRKAVEL